MHWTPCLFFLDQGFLVEYGLDIFNMPHTGTILRHSQNWLCQLRDRIPLRRLATSTFSGDTHASLRNNQSHKIMVTSTFISSNGKHDFCYIRRTYLHRTSNDTCCFLNSIITSNRSLTSFLPTRLAA